MKSSSTGTMHEDYSRIHRQRTSSDRQFGLVIGLAFLAVGLWPLHRGEPARVLAIAAGVPFLLLALAWPAGLAPLNKLWTALGLALGRIVNPVAMGAMFYLLIAPIGICLRLTGRDSLRLKRDGRQDSYWILRDPPGPRPETLIRQF